jgi:hypothetical protein
MIRFFVFIPTCSRRTSTQIRKGKILPPVDTTVSTRSTPLLALPHLLTATVQLPAMDGQRHEHGHRQ